MKTELDRIKADPDLTPLQYVRMARNSRGISSVSALVTIELLCLAFHGLRGRPGTDPWDPRQLRRWLKSPEAGSGARYAGQFVLSIWNHNSTRFDVHSALLSWDDSHREAFRAWAMDPWWL